MIGGTFCSACRGPQGNDDVAAASSEPPDGNVGRCLKPDPDPPAICGQHAHHDSIADHQTLANLATQDQHGFPSMSGS